MTSPGQRLLRPSLDPAGFSLKGVVPYGWQPLGQRYEVPVTGAHGSNIQVLGFEGRDGAKHGYRHKGYVTIETVIEVFNDYCQTINEPTVVVLDNACCHTSGVETGIDTGQAANCPIGN